MTLESMLTDSLEILKQGLEHHNTFAQNNPRLNNYLTMEIF